MTGKEKEYPTMAFKYVEEQLNSLDKGLLSQLFVSQQEQVEELTRHTKLIDEDEKM